MTEQEELKAVMRELDSQWKDDWYSGGHTQWCHAERAAREILALRKQEIYLEGQNADLRKRVAELTRAPECDMCSAPCVPSTAHHGCFERRCAEHLGLAVAVRRKVQAWE